ncbi:DUF1254 domain-containing protein [Rhodococcus aerolatus]
MSTTDEWFLGYAEGSVPQLQSSRGPDVRPADATARRAWATALAVQATVYGLPAVLQYAQMCAQCLVPEAPGRLFTFQHERATAGPDYEAFRVPNVDTLYSNGWVDLGAGPVELRLPAFGGRYYTVQLLDAYSNAVNISSRTSGPGPGTYWLVDPAWSGAAPSGVTVVPVPGRIVWLLLRIQVTDGELAGVHALQDRVSVAPTGPAPSDVTTVVSPDAVREDPQQFFRALDAVLRLNGCPRSELAHVRQFRTLGLLSREPWSAAALDAETWSGTRQGFGDAMAVVRASRPQLGSPTGTGWTRVADKGAHGHNYLARAVMNEVGLAANVVQENTSFNTYADGDGRRLDGTDRDHRLTLPSPPPHHAFWSLTVYAADTGRLVHGVAQHGIGSADPALEVGDDGRVEVVLSRRDPRAGNWLPCPAGEFFLVLRVYSPGAEVVDGTWLPPAVRVEPGPPAPRGPAPP